MQLSCCTAVHSCTLCWSQEPHSTAICVIMSLALLFSIDKRFADTSSVSPACCFCLVPLYAAGKQTHPTMQHTVLKSLLIDLLPLLFICPEAGSGLLAAEGFYGGLLYTPCLVLPDAPACSQVVVKVIPCVLHRVVNFGAATNMMQISSCPSGLRVSQRAVRLQGFLQRSPTLLCASHLCLMHLQTTCIPQACISISFLCLAPLHISCRHEHNFCWAGWSGHQLDKRKSLEAASSQIAVMTD